MNTTNLAYTENLEEIKRVSRFTLKETNWIRNYKTAKLIATIPFAANCDEAERTAIAHLCIYLAELRGFQKYYAHMPSDDVDLFTRLGFISTFEGGDKKIIEYGMNLLALEMIEGYNKSKEKDSKNDIYNPFVSESWNYDEMKYMIIGKLQNIDCKELKNWFESPADAWNW